jgi:hypothetical protein
MTESDRFPKGYVKQYATRDAEALGEYYMRHLDAMTREDLYSKSAIAGELAWRDARVAELEKALDDEKADHALSLEALASPEDVARDAKRWRALFQVGGRVRVLGSSSHIGVELWSHYENSGDDKADRARLVEYADRVRDTNVWLKDAALAAAGEE